MIAVYVCKTCIKIRVYRYYLRAYFARFVYPCMSLHLYQAPCPLHTRCLKLSTKCEVRLHFNAGNDKQQFSEVFNTTIFVKYEVKKIVNILLNSLKISLSICSCIYQEIVRDIFHRWMFSLFLVEIRQKGKHFQER